MPISASPERPSSKERLLDQLVEEMKALPKQSRRRGRYITRIRELEEQIDAESGL
jgi:hypothetical protein